MNRVRQEADVQVTLWIQLTEVELRALDALAGYGANPFLKVFYERLGQAYMRPHEAGIRSLFSTIQAEVPMALHRANAARSALQQAGRSREGREEQVAAIIILMSRFTALLHRLVPTRSRS